jgi:uncharacterized protein (DUF1778 family)
MPTTEITKQERMHIRLDTLSKQKLEKAASYSHKTLSEFVLAQSLAAAENIINEHEQISLSNTDWTLFLDALPPQPKTPNCKKPWHCINKRLSGIDAT